MNCKYKQIELIIISTVNAIVVCISISKTQATAINNDDTIDIPTNIVYFVIALIEIMIFLLLVALDLATCVDICFCLFQTLFSHHFSAKIKTATTTKLVCDIAIFKFCLTLYRLVTNAISKNSDKNTYKTPLIPIKTNVNVRFWKTKKDRNTPNPEKNRIAANI